MITILWSITAFIIAVMILVTVHEFGHFIVARALGIKVQIFSIGFGRALWTRKTKSGVRYILASIPLGGYVKLLDEANGKVKKTDLPFAFNRQSLPKRFAVVIAGPAFNLLFAILCFWSMFLLGIQSLVPIVGDVTPNSIAERAGLHKNDEIIAVNQHKEPSWRDVRYAIIGHLGKHRKVELLVKHTHHKHKRPVYLNLLHHRLSSSQGILSTIGIVPYMPPLPSIIGDVVPGGAAKKAGLEAGDEIIAINDKPVLDWMSVAKIVRKHPGELLEFKLTRGDKRLTIFVRTERRARRGQEPYGIIGVKSLPLEFPQSLIRNQHFTFGKAFVKACTETYNLTLLSFRIIGKLFLGHVSLGNITGPLGIAQGAGQSASIGFNYFLHFLALISVSLAVINLLPIPILDGGHLVYLLLEAIRRKPVSDDVRLLGFKLGVLFIISITVLALYNDITRIF